MSEPVERRKPRGRKDVDLVTQMDESYGRDIGCEVPLCLLHEQEAVSAKNDIRCLGAVEWIAATEALEAHGVVLLRGLVPLPQVRELRSRLHMHSSALDRARNTTDLSPVREYDFGPLHDEDPELDAAISTPGHRHVNFRGHPLEDV